MPRVAGFLRVNVLRDTDTGRVRARDRQRGGDNAGEFIASRGFLVAHIGQDFALFRLAWVSTALLESRSQTSKITPPMDTL